MTTDGKGKYDSSKTYTYRHMYSVIPVEEDLGLGWYVGSVRAPNNITIKNGEGLSINNKLKVAIKLRFSGAVTLTGRSFRVSPGYSLVGNLTPCDVNLKNVRILNSDGSVWDVADEDTVACVIQKMTTDGKGKYDSSKTYTYRHMYSVIPVEEDLGLGWYVGSVRAPNNITIGSGEGLSINNKLKTDIIVEFPSPIVPTAE